MKRYARALSFKHHFARAQTTPKLDTRLRGRSSLETVPCLFFPLRQVRRGFGSDLILGAQVFVSGAVGTHACSWAGAAVMLHPLLPGREQSVMIGVPFFIC